MERAKVFIINGLMALALALIMWRLTGSFVGWLVFFAPGAALVILGWIVALTSHQD